jgi:MFS family permease
VVVTQDFLETMDLVGPTKTATLGTVTAIYDVGCFIGALVACWLGEVLGRKKTVLIGTTIMSVGAILQITAYSLGQMFVGRVVAGKPRPRMAWSLPPSDTSVSLDQRHYSIPQASPQSQSITSCYSLYSSATTKTFPGIGNGMNTATAPVWQTEASTIKWRGKLVVIELILNIAGFSLSNWVTFGLSFVGGAVAWRVPLALQFIFIVILFATVPWLPESPRWMIAHEQEDEAFKILADLEGLSEDDPFIITQHKEIVYTVQYERANTVPWSQLLRGKTGDKGGTKTMRRLLLGMGTQFIQQVRSPARDH